MSATSTDSAATAAPNAIRLHSPAIFRPGSSQIAETQSVGTPASGGTPSSGGGASTASSDAAQSLRFSATCQAADAVGLAVRMDGAPNAVTTVTSAQAYPTVGIIVAKASATTCTVQTYGLATGAVSGLTPLQRYFVGADGSLVTASQAYAAGQFVQLVGFAVTATTLFIQPSGTIGQLASARTASGDDATPSLSSDGQALLYGGVLYGTDAPAADYGRKGDSFLQYTPDGGVEIWGPKPSDTDWQGQERSLIGPAGNRIYVRDTDPDGSVTPAVGDLWFNRQTGTVFDAA